MARDLNGTTEESLQRVDVPAAYGSFEWLETDLQPYESWDVYAHSMRAIMSNIENNKDELAETFNKYDNYDYVKMSYDEDTGEYTQTGLSAEDYEAEIANGSNGNSVYMTQAGYTNTCLMSLIRNSVNVVRDVADGNMTVEDVLNYDLAGSITNESLYSEALAIESKEADENYLISDDNQVNDAYNAFHAYFDVPEPSNGSESVYTDSDKLAAVLAIGTASSCAIDQAQSEGIDKFEAYDYVKIAYDEKNDCYTKTGLTELDYQNAMLRGDDDNSIYMSQEGYVAAKSAAITADCFTVGRYLLKDEITAEDAAKYDYSATDNEIYNIAVNCKNNGVDLAEHDVTSSDVFNCISENCAAIEDLNELSDNQKSDLPLSFRFDAVIRAMDAFGCVDDQTIETGYEKDDELVTGDLSEYAPF